MNPWDFALIVVVSLQATALAYLRQPRAKALLLSFPFPFSMAFLSVGHPLDVTNILGLGLLLVFFSAVGWIYLRLGHHIVLAIVASALLYALTGSALARFLVRDDRTFWTGLALILCLATLMRMRRPRTDGPPHRSPLPVYVKLPLIMAVITLLILIKQYLQGFTTIFPMVGVIAAYEARHSLWTMTRQIPLIMLTMAPMMTAMRLTQPHLPPSATLAVGWLFFGMALTAVRRLDRKQHQSGPADTLLPAPGEARQAKSYLRRPSPPISTLHATDAIPPCDSA